MLTQEEQEKYNSIKTYEDLKNFGRNVIGKKKKVRIITDYGIDELYEHYNKEVLNPLSEKQFKDITKDFSKLMIENMLMKNREYRLPCSLGIFRVRKFKMSFGAMRTMRIDWATTKRIGKKVFHTNEHRNNHHYKFFWGKKKVKNGSVYSFIPSRANNRRLANILKTMPEIDYLE